MKDEDQKVHYGAYLGAIAGEHDAKGRPHYPTFDSFYSHKTQKQDRFEKLREHIRRKQQNVRNGQ